jgi:hypothetical protein
LIAVLALFAVTLLPGAAPAQDAAPPVGMWQGSSVEGQVVVFIGANGQFMGQSTGSWPLRGRWYWEPTTGGGFLTVQPQGTAGNDNRFFSVTYIDANTMNLAIPSAWVTLRRR